MRKLDDINENINPWGGKLDNLGTKGCRFRGNRLKLSRDKYSKLVNDSVHCIQVMWRSNVGLIQHRFEKLICAPIGYLHVMSYKFRVRLPSRSSV